MKKKENRSCPHCRCSSVHRVLDKGLKKEIELFQRTGVLKVVSSSCVFDGEPYKFETDCPASFICKICGNVVKDPHLATCCGNQFCHSCIWNNLNQNASTRCGHGLCYICRSRLKYIKDKEVEAEVNFIKVLCPNYDMGCQWTGELGARSVYLNHCQDCTHKRIRCEHCQFECTRESNDAHLKECKRLKICCPNPGCREKVAREELGLHRDQCDFELVKCDYDTSICTKTMQRRNLKTHLRTHESSQDKSESASYKNDGTALFLSRLVLAAIVISCLTIGIWTTCKWVMLIYLIYVMMCLMCALIILRMFVICITCMMWMVLMWIIFMMWMMLMWMICVLVIECVQSALSNEKYITVTLIIFIIIYLFGKVVPFEQ